MIKLQNIAKQYKTESDIIDALKDINLELASNGLVFILGESGCGKTTLFNLLGAMDNVSGGQIIVQTQDISSFTKSELVAFRKDNIGIISQKYNLIDEYNVYENIRLVLDLQGSKAGKEVIDTALSNVGLEGYGKRKITELIEGEKQRVAIAMAIVKQPFYILAEEPSNRLDSKTAEDLFMLLKSLSSTRLIVVFTKDRDIASKYADRIIELNAGEVLSDEQTSQNNSINVLKDDKKPTVEQTRNKKLKFGAIKQTFKFATRNMWNRWIKLTTALVLAVISLISFGLTFVQNTDSTVGNIYESYYNDDTSLGYITSITDDGSNGVDKGFDGLDNETHGRIQRKLGSGAIPIYINKINSVNNEYGGELLGVITEENILDFGFEVVYQKKDYSTPRTVNEVVLLQTQDNVENIEIDKPIYSDNLGFELEIITVLKYDKQAIAKYGEQVTNSIAEKYGKKLKSSENLHDASAKIFEMLKAGVHFVSQDYIDLLYKERNSYYDISFSYNEAVSNTSGSGVQDKLVNARGWTAPLKMLTNYQAAITFKNAVRNANQPLSNNEVIVSMDFAKVILSSKVDKVVNEITDDEAIVALKSGEIQLVDNTVKLCDKYAMNVESIENIEVVGVYTQITNRMNWADKNAVSSQGDFTKLTDPPIIMADDVCIKGVEKPITNNVQNYIINQASVELDKETIDLLYENDMYVYNVFARDFRETVNSINDRDRQSIIYLIIAIVCSILTILAILYYSWSKINDNENNIGVFWTQGMNTSNIVGMYFIQVLILMLIALIVAIPCAIGLSFSELLNLQNSASNMVIIRTMYIGAGSIGAMIGLGIGMAAFGALMPIIKYSKKSPPKYYEKNKKI